MLVTSEMLREAAEQDREWPSEIPSEPGVFVTPEQLHTAARLIDEAGDVRIDYPQRLRSRNPRPAFIDASQQENPEVLVLIVGIIPGEKHYIARDGAEVYV